MTESASRQPVAASAELHMPSPDGSAAPSSANKNRLWPPQGRQGAWRPEKLYRNPKRGIFGGVCAGCGEYFGVHPTRVRIVMCLLGVAGFVPGYILMWIFIRAQTEQEPSPRQAAQVALRPQKDLRREQRDAYFLALLALIGGIVFWGIDMAVAIVPVAVMAVGAAVLWNGLDSISAEEHLGHLFDFADDRRATVRILGGAALVFIGVASIVLWRIDTVQISSVLLGLMSILGGILLLTVPLWVRLLRGIEEARAARVRAEERAMLASHLHDSVLQTLALIQKRAGDQAAVASLARQQERELRQWLFEGRGERVEAASLAAGIEDLVAEMDARYALCVSPVVVGGETQMADNEYAALAAARECLVNIAKHAGVNRADLFCEVLSAAEGDAIELFVRDRGNGFDPEKVPVDRRGLALSVRKRIEDRGGTVRVRSTLGAGTEVRIWIPRGRGHGNGADPVATTGTPQDEEK